MTLTLHRDQQTRRIPLLPGQTILAALQAARIPAVPAPCGGRGTCGKCRVTLGDGRQVLACQTPAEDGMEVWLSASEAAVHEGGSCLIAPTDGEEGYALACDIGTTTVVCHLLRLSDGARLTTRSGVNAQSVFGADVIARISACTQGHLGDLHGLIEAQLRELANGLCSDAGISPAAVRRWVIAGNTVMDHLAAGLSPEGIGQAPFTPLSLFGDVLPENALAVGTACPVWVAPCVSGYVGGDITAGLLAAGLHWEETPCLFLDVGTNGEMALGCGDRFVCCATAAGPAFEGAQIDCGMAAGPGAVSAVSWENGRLQIEVIGGGAPTGICGSGLIDLLAVLLELGVVDEGGRMADPEDLPEALAGLVTTDRRVPLSPDGSVYFSQADVRRLQLAKAAIAAGMQVMMARAGLDYDQIGALVLAGGFGSHIRPESAARIGLIPPALLSHTRAVGNAAGEGAVSAALSAAARAELKTLAGNCEYLELSGLAAFSDAFMDAMLFE